MRKRFGGVGLAVFLVLETAGIAAAGPHRRSCGELYETCLSNPKNTQVICQKRLDDAKKAGYWDFGRGKGAVCM